MSERNVHEMHLHMGINHCILNW